MTWAEFLPLVFMAVMGLALLAYVVLDGYDLGVGLLLPLGTDDQKDTMISSIGPFWDANETWLVLGVGVLLVAFPKAHGMVTGFDNGGLGWAFSLGIALTLPAAYVLLGAGWLIMKTEGELQHRAVHWARRVLWPMGLALLAISAATPLVNQAVVEKWFGVPQIFALLPVPIVCAAAFFAVRWVVTRPRLIDAGYGWLVFVNTVLIFVLAFFGLAYSIFPDIVIGRLTVWEAASATGSLTVIFIGVAVTLPVIVAYTIYMYRVFWGKARALSYQ
ncbi:MAG: cytochrome d ubiquinol oxidase subunit II [Hydrogenophaga sp.]|nr:cytochrome d ubiquinol oxidase subunit II [Hydrogenophaga sp.]